MIRFLVVTPGADSEEWFESAPAAEAAVARRLGLTPGQLDALRRRITVDPLVVRRDGSRWRSRQAWSVRSDTASVRIYEMLQIDEALYDH
jgi:hypothetical protein